MTVPTGATQTYTRVGIREDLTDIISNIDPIERPFINNVGKGKANQTLHEWQTDGYRTAVDTNAQIEGDDASAAARAATVRLTNYTQISDENVITSGTDRAVKNAGRGDEHAYQVAKAGVELQRDMETQLLSVTPKAAGSAGVARESAAVGSWIATNFSGGTTSAAPTGDGTNSPSDGTDRAVSETHLRTVMEGIFTETGRSRGYLALMGPAIKSEITLNYSGIATNFKDIGSSNVAPIVGATDVYVSDFGEIALVPDVFMPDNATYVLNKELWKVCYLRGMTTNELAKTGDADKDQIIVEYTLESLNEKGNAQILDQDPTL